MKKRKVLDEIFSTESNYTRISELPEGLLPDDIINVIVNNDGDVKLNILRGREETDEEYIKRTEIEDRYLEIRKENRYKEYLKLQQEFGK